MTHAKLLACTFALLASLPLPALALDGQRDDVRDFIRQMAERHGFDSTELAKLFERVEPRPSIIETMSRPAERTLAWHEYRARFITGRRIARGVETGRQQTAALERAAAAGVPPAVILAITGVETFYGEITGRHRVIDALATLAFDYPRRAEFFRGELEQFLLMTREEDLDPLAPRGSYAGAMGVPQFMPSSFRGYAVDGDGDGHRDLWGNWSDVFASVANYLARHGWRSGEPVMAPADAAGADLDGLDLDGLQLDETVGSLRARGVGFEVALPDDASAMLLKLDGAAGPEYRVAFRNFYVITRYNRSRLYASAVNDLAEELAVAMSPPEAPANPAFATAE